MTGSVKNVLNTHICYRGSGVHNVNVFYIRITSSQRLVLLPHSFQNVVVLVSGTYLVQSGYQLVERLAVYHQTRHAVGVARDDVRGTQIITVKRHTTEKHTPLATFYGLGWLAARDVKEGPPRSYEAIRVYGFLFHVF